MTAGGASIVFGNSGGTSTGTYPAPTDSGSGIYVTTFTGVTSGSATTITATIGGSPVSSTLPQLTVVPGNPASLSFNVQPTTSTSPTNPFPIQPVVQVLDSNGNIIATGPSSAATIAITLTTISGAGTLGGTTTMNAVSGVANFSGKGMYISSVGSYQLTATASALSLTANSSTITITSTTPVISSNIPIQVAYVTSNVPTITSVNTASIATPTGAGSAATYAPGTFTMALLTPSGSPAPSVPGNPFTPYTNLINASTPTFQISVTGANSPNCSTLSPFSAVSCYINGFNLNLSDIMAATTTPSTSYLQINDGYLNSNQLTVSKTLIDQVSNIHNNANDFPIVGNGYNGVDYLNQMDFNGMHYFINTSGKLMSIDSTLTVRQLTNLINGGNDNVVNILPFNGQIYFEMGNPIHLYRLSTSGTLVKLTTTTACYYPNTAVVNTSTNRLYFFQQNSNGYCKLHYIDTSDNVVQVSDIQGASADDGITSSLSYFNGYVYFSGNCTNAVCGNTTGSLMRIDSSNNITVIQQGSAFNQNQPIVWNNKLYFWETFGYYPLYSIDSSNNLVQVSNAFNTYSGSYGEGVLTPFNGYLYGMCFNSYSVNKLCKLSPSGAVTQVADIAGYPNVADQIWLLGVLQQSGADYELYFVAQAGALFRKLFKVNTSGNVYQVSNFINGANDFSNGYNANTYITRFSLPTGPGGINEFYFQSQIGTATTSYQKLFKVYPGN